MAPQTRGGLGRETAAGRRGTGYNAVRGAQSAGLVDGAEGEVDTDFTEDAVL